MDDENAIDEYPPLPRYEALPPDALHAKQERLQREAEEFRAREATQEAADTTAALRRIMARIQSDASARAALPCYPLAQRGDVVGAARLCDAARAHRACRFQCDERTCPREVALEQHRQASRRVAQAAMPVPLVQLVLGWRWGGIGPDNRLMPVVAPRETAALGVVREWLQGRGWALVLAGNAGVGKSAAAAWALSEVGGVFLPAADLGRLDSAQGRSGRRVGDLVEQALVARLVVLDDAGTEYSGDSGYAVARVAELLIARADAGRRTLVTTNLDRAAFLARYGGGAGDERLRDRLRGQEYVTCGGASLRGAA